MANPITPTVAEKIVTTDTSANSLVVGGASPVATSGTGGIKAGPILSTSSVTDSVGSMATIRAGGIGIASQAALDLITAGSGTQLARTAAGTALQVPRINAAGNGWEFALVTSPRIVQGRLTLESGVPVSSTDQSAKTTVYFTPCNGDQFMFYDGTLVTFAELSLSLAAYTASRPYDIFGYNNGGVLALESLVWTSATARATGVTRQTNGVWTKTGDTTRMLLGTIYINSSGGQTDDTRAKRNVSNVYNRIARTLKVFEANTTWTYAVATWRQANASTANQLEVTAALAEVPVHLVGMVSSHSQVGANERRAMAIGYDSTTTPHADCLIQETAGIAEPAMPISHGASITMMPAVGLHLFQWLEKSIDSSTITFDSGGQGGAAWSGLTGTVWG